MRGVALLIGCPWRTSDQAEFWRLCQFKSIEFGAAALSALVPGRSAENDRSNEDYYQDDRRVHMKRFGAVVKKEDGTEYSSDHPPQQKKTSAKGDISGGVAVRKELLTV